MKKYPKNWYSLHRRLCGHYTIPDLKAFKVVTFVRAYFCLQGTWWFRILLHISRIFANRSSFSSRFISKGQSAIPLKTHCFRNTFSPYSFKILWSFSKDKVFQKFFTVILWKPDKPVSNIREFWKQQGWFVIRRSMQVAFSGFCSTLAVTKLLRSNVSQKSPI